MVVVNPADRFAADYDPPFSNPQAYQGKYFDFAMLSRGEVWELRRARPELTVEDPELRYGARMAVSLPPEPDRYAFHGGEENGRPLAKHLRRLAQLIPDASDDRRAFEWSRVPRGGGDGGGDYELFTIINRPASATTRSEGAMDGKEQRQEYWFDPARGGLLVFERSLADGQPTPAGESIGVAYVRSADGAWLPAYAASWRHQIAPDPGKKYGGQPAAFVFTLADYDSVRPDPAAGGFTWRDLGLRPGEDTLMLQSDDPARNGGFQVLDGELIEMNEAIRRQLEDERGGGL